MSIVSYSLFIKEGRTAIFSNIPIHFLEHFRSYYANFGLHYKIRYRGPRNTIADSNRSYLSKRSTCLKENAVSFSVYTY